jgi:hypothetical protein
MAWLPGKAGKQRRVPGPPLDSQQEECAMHKKTVARGRIAYIVTDEERRDIWTRLSYGERVRTIAEDYGVSDSVIRRIAAELSQR